MNKTKTAIATISAIAVILFFATLFLFGSTSAHEGLPIMLTNISQSKPPGQYEIGDNFHHLVLQSVLYKTCNTSKEQHPDYVTLTG